MQEGLVQHYFHEALDNWLKGLSLKFPMSPLSAVIKNYLYMSDDGSEISRLRVASLDLYNTIKQFEQLSDDVAYEEPPIGEHLND